MTSLLSFTPALLLQGGDRWLEFVGRLHVVAVHFPIALLWMAGLAELVRVVRRSGDRSPTAFVCLSIGALSAVTAAGMGWVHAEVEPLGSSVEQTLFLHRWSGVATAVVAVLAWLLAFRGGRVYRLVLAVGVVLVSVSGHFGGTLVYGEGYLLDVLRAPEAGEEGVGATEGRGVDGPPVDVKAVAEELPTLNFAFDVQPLLTARCEECHGARKQKGGLRLDDLPAHFTRPEEEWVIRPGDAEQSELYRRLVLPRADEDAMPPKAEALTAEQIAVLRAWIDQGASLE